jgi:hypothetical protein
VIGAFHAPVAAAPRQPLSAGERRALQRRDNHAGLDNHEASFLVGHFAAHRDDGGGRRKGELRGRDGGERQLAVFGAAVVAVVGEKGGGLALERVRNGGAHRRGVVLESDEILAAGRDDGAGGRMVGVAGTDADQGAGEIGIFEQRAGGGHFVLCFDGEHRGDRDGGAGFRRDQADHLREPVGVGLAVEGEGGGSWPCCACNHSFDTDASAGGSTRPRSVQNTSRPGATRAFLPGGRQ